MLRATLSSSRAQSRTVRPRSAPLRHAHHRPLADTTTTTAAAAAPSPPPPPPPPPKYIRFATVYPFILLSILTSLALNLSVQRTARETERARHRAQISVLEDLVARVRAGATGSRGTLTEDEVERELELVGLGRGRGKEAVSAEMSVKADEATSWREVFLGKRGKGYEPEDDHTDWEAVFRQAEEAERTKQVPISAVPAPQPPLPPPPAALNVPPALAAAPSSPDAARPKPSKPLFL